MLCALALALGCPGIARAQWPGPTLGLPVCTAAGTQAYQMAISDGAGGMFVAWSDTRFVLSDIYVQHVSASGAVLWHADGILGCGAANRQSQPVLASDGEGGIVIAWRDYRNEADGDIYAQRINAAGTLLWDFNGVPVCTVVGQQVNPVITANSTGGGPASVVIAWEDGRGAPRIFAQRLSATGAALWDAGGKPVSSSFAAQFEPVIVTGGAFGTIVAWSEQGAADYDIYAQHLGNEGQPLWDPAGTPICTAPGDQFHPVAVSDSASGAWFAWVDDRATSLGVYAQRVTLPGFAVLPDGGAPVCSYDADQFAPAAVADGRGGLLVAWTDARVRSDIYAQRLAPSGTRMWSPTGEVVCNEPGSHAFPSIAADGRGGGIVVWEDDRTGTGTTDIYAQRIDSLGYAKWTPEGVGACTATGSQYQPTVVSSADTIGIVIWVDLRGTNDLYCQRLPLVVESPQLPVPMFAAPNPATERASFAFALPGAGRTELTIYDAAGRRIRTLAHTMLPAGDHQVPWDARDDSGRACAEGVYFARLAVDGRALSTRSITIRR
jgi:hypothetical protein